MIDLPRTVKGRATRARIVAAAAGLVGERGVAGTSLDDVIERAAVSKGQLYHYFQDKADLLRAVVAHQADTVLAAQEPQLRALDGWDSIRARLDRLVAPTMAAVQGGLVLTQARREPAQLARALGAAYSRLRAQQASTQSARSS